MKVYFQGNYVSQIIQHFFNYQCKILCILVFLKCNGKLRQDKEHKTYFIKMSMAIIIKCMEIKYKIEMIKSFCNVLDTNVYNPENKSISIESNSYLSTLFFHLFCKYGEKSLRKVIYSYYYLFNGLCYIYNRNK